MIKIVVRKLLRKILELVGSLLLLCSLSFFLLRLLPGGPFDEEAALNPLIKENLIQKWGLNQPVYIQVQNYFLSILRGDWGPSMSYPDKSVWEIIQQGLSHTLALSLIAMFFVIFGSLFISMVAVLNRGRWLETLIDQVLIVLLSLPSLFLGPLLIYFFGIYLNLLPVAFLSSPLHYILPVLTLSFRPLSILTRLLKNSLVENLYADYVRTAKAKGLSSFGIIFGHVLRNSMIPYLNYAGPLMASLVSGSFLVETLFVIPGLGSQFITSISDRDYTLIIGLTVFYGFLLILCNAITEVIISIVDPRMREKA